MDPPGVHIADHLSEPAAAAAEKSKDRPASSSSTEKQRASARVAREKEPLIMPSDPRFRVSANGINGWKLQDVYDVGKELGRGAFGTVYQCKHRFAPPSSEWENVAIKRTRPTSLDFRDAGKWTLETYDGLERYCSQVKVLLRLKEAASSARALPVLCLYEVFLSGRDFYMVTDLMQHSLDDWPFEVNVCTEDMVKDISRTVLRGIAFMHRNGVVHRNLKHQTILFGEKNNYGSLKIASFVLACVLEKGETACDFCRTPNSVLAPEIYLGEAYRFEVDMFSFGGLLYHLLSGERPFPSTNSQILKRHTIELRYNVSSVSWQNVSDSAKNLIHKLLAHKEERLTAEQALAHPWLSTQGGW